MTRYARLWWRFVGLSCVRELEYRVNFALGVLEGLAQLALAVVTFLLVYRFTPAVAGWTEAQALLLVGVYRVVDAAVSLQIAPNMAAISGAIRQGDMDFLLLRPVSSQFLVSLRLLSPPEAVNLLIGALLVVVAGNAAGVAWSAGRMAVMLGFLLCGLLLLYALWFAIATCAFWLVQVDTLDALVLGVFQAARYPVDYFKGWLRALLTFAVPVAFATSFPAEALLGRADLRLLPVGMLLAALALAASHRFWAFALRHYTSASS